MASTGSFADSAALLQIPNDIFDKNKARLIDCSDHRRPSVVSNESPSSFICLVSLCTLLALPSVDEDDMWQRKSLTSDSGNTLVLNDGVGRQVELEINGEKERPPFANRPHCMLAQTTLPFQPLLLLDDEPNTNPYPHLSQSLCPYLSMN